MSSLILRTATRWLFPLLLIFSAYLTLRGHNAPGGGFIGGLVATGAFSLILIAEGPTAMRRALRLTPLTWVGTGLAAALFAGILPWFFGEPLLKGMWASIPLGFGATLKQGTPLIFDLGVFAVVVGSTLSVLVELEEN